MKGNILTGVMGEREKRYIEYELFKRYFFNCASSASSSAIREAC